MTVRRRNEPVGSGNGLVHIPEGPFCNPGLSPTGALLLAPTAPHYARPPVITANPAMNGAPSHSAPDGTGQRPRPRVEPGHSSSRFVWMTPGGAPRRRRSWSVDRALILKRHERAAPTSPSYRLAVGPSPCDACQGGTGPCQDGACAPRRHQAEGAAGLAGCAASNRTRQTQSGASCETAPRRVSERQRRPVAASEPADGSRLEPATSGLPYSAAGPSIRPDMRPPASPCCHVPA